MFFFIASLFKLPIGNFLQTKMKRAKAKRESVIDAEVKQEGAGGNSLDGEHWCCVKILTPDRLKPAPFLLNQLATTRDNFAFSERH